MLNLTDTEPLLAGYREWLADNTTIEEIDEGVVEIILPFLDRHNDYICVYAVDSDRGMVLSDQGDTLDDNPTFTIEDLKPIALGFGISFDEGILSIDVTPETFATGLQSLLQTILAVNARETLTDVEKVYRQMIAPKHEITGKETPRP